MSLETAVERKRKRIVEHVLGPFDNAFEAIRFGNTVESLVNGALKARPKFRQSIGATDTALAITGSYTGETMLKTAFLEVQENEDARFICAQLRASLEIHNLEYAGRVQVTDETIRDKPLPQKIGG